MENKHPPFIRGEVVSIRPKDRTLTVVELEISLFSSKKKKPERRFLVITLLKNGRGGEFEVTKVKVENVKLTPETERFIIDFVKRFNWQVVQMAPEILSQQDFELLTNGIEK